MSNSNVISIKVKPTKNSQNVNTMPKILQEAIEKLDTYSERLLATYNRMYFGEDIENGYRTYKQAVFNSDGNLVNHYYRVQKDTEADVDVEFETDENGNYILEECTLFKWYQLLSDVQTKEDLHQASVQLLIATYQDQTESSISDFEQSVNQTVADNLSALLRAEAEHKLELQSLFEGLTAETTGEIYQAKNNSLQEIDAARTETLETISASRTEVLNTISASRSEILNTISETRTEVLNTISALRTDTLDKISDANNNSLGSIDTAATNALTSINASGTSALDSISSAKGLALENISAKENEALNTISTTRTEVLNTISASRTEVLTTINNLRGETLETIEASKTEVLNTISEQELTSLNNIELSKADAVQYVVDEVNNLTDTAVSNAQKAVSDAEEVSENITQAVNAIQNANLGLSWVDFTESDWIETDNLFMCVISDIAAPVCVFKYNDEVREFIFGVDITVNADNQTVLYSTNKFDGSLLGARNILDESSGEDEDDNEFTDEELEALKITDWDDIEV